MNQMRWLGTLMPVLGAALLCGRAGALAGESVVAPGAKLELVKDGFQFTEGPAADAQGNVFFTDVRASRIYKWSESGELTLFRENTGGANGLYFSSDGRLMACEGDNGRIVSLDLKGQVTIIADQYGGKRFNRPNDLWVDPWGGVYFSDPMYARGEKTQDGEHVYYVSPDHKHIVRVIEDMTRPNGLIGTPDGKMLYVADPEAQKTYRYAIQEDGTLTGKTLFVNVGSDGMTIDEAGNVYVTQNAVLVFDPNGQEIASIKVPENPTNLTFAGKDRRTLFITARSTAYTLRMRVAGPPPVFRSSRSVKQP
jgi:gluconolactonase